MSSSLESTYRQNISTPVKQTVSDRVSQKGTPTVEQVLNEAEVVLDLILKSTSDPLHKRAKKRRAELDARNQATVRPQKLNYGHYQCGDDNFQESSLKIRITNVREKITKASAKGTYRLDDYDESDSIFQSDEKTSVFSAALSINEKSSSAKWFHERTNSENDEILEKVADELARIADNYNLKSPQIVDKKSVHDCIDGKVTIDDKTTEVRTMIDGNQDVETFVTTTENAELESSPSFRLDCDVNEGVITSQEISQVELLDELVTTCEYNTFKQVVYRNIGDSVGWTQLAQMFRLTQLAVQCAGLGSAVAGQIQKFTMRYFQDRYATWIVEQGGWDAVLIDQRIEFNAELD